MDAVDFAYRTESQASADALLAKAHIAGRGIILSFLITTYSCVILGSLIFIANRVTRSELTETTRRRKQAIIWLDILQRNLLSFSSNQVISDIWLHISAFMERGTMSIYHHRIVAHLSLLAAVTHIMTLIFLRGHFTRTKLLQRLRIILLAIDSFVGGSGVLHFLRYAFLSKETDWTSLSHFQGSESQIDSLSPTRLALLVIFIVALLGFVPGVGYINQQSKTYQGGPKTHSISSASFMWIALATCTILILVISGSGLSHSDALGNAPVPIYPQNAERFWSLGQVLAMLPLMLQFLSGSKLLYDSHEVTRANQERTHS